VPYGLAVNDILVRVGAYLMSVAKHHVDLGTCIGSRFYGRRRSCHSENGHRRRVMGTVPEEVYTLCDPCIKRKMSRERSRTPSCGERFCRRLSGGVTWDASREGIGVYCRPKIGN
jgi:hypothetical protein